MRWVAWLLVFTPLAGCEGDTSRVVEEKVREQVGDFRRREEEKCRKALLEEAERIVDSVLLMEAMAEVADSLRNLQPARPVKPPALVPLDSAEVKPIFDLPPRRSTADTAQ